MNFRLLSFATLILAAVTAQAQFSQQTVSITGSVTDGNGKALEGARVSLMDSSTGATSASAYTNAQGTFIVDSVRPGMYEIVAQSGVAEIRDHVDARLMTPSVTLHFPPTANVAAPDKQTVSVADYKVPKKARQAFEKATKAMAKGEMQEAQKYDDEALDAYPQYADALTMRAVIKLDAGKPDEALADVDQATKTDSSNERALLVMAACYNMQKKFDDAIRVLNRAAQLAPNAWQGFYEMAKAQFGKSDYEAALKWLDRAQAAAPTYAPITIAKAKTLVALKNYSDAVHELEAFISAKPQDPQVAQARTLLDQLKASPNR